MKRNTRSGSESGPHRREGGPLGPLAIGIGFFLPGWVEWKQGVRPLAAIYSLSNSLAILTGVFCWGTRIGYALLAWAWVIQARAFRRSLLPARLPARVPGRLLGVFLPGRGPRPLPPGPEFPGDVRMADALVP